MPPNLKKISEDIDTKILKLLETTEFEKKRGERTLDCYKCIQMHENLGIIQGLRQAQEIVNKEMVR